jgi:hypothetical protein
VGVHGGIGGAINNWTQASLSGEQTINGHGSLLATLPTPNTIPAGWVLTISLGNDDNGNVNSVTFTQWSPADWNKPPVTNTVTLTDLTTTGGQPVTSAYLAPILTFQLLLLGPGDSQHATFTSGAGTITFTAATPLAGAINLPLGVPGDVSTAETSNSTYAPLPLLPSRIVTQPFSFSPTT